jgi:hypothetical protein
MVGDSVNAARRLPHAGSSMGRDKNSFINCTLPMDVGQRRLIEILRVGLRQRRRHPEADGNLTMGSMVLA